MSRLRPGLELVRHALAVKLSLELGQPVHAADAIRRTRDALDTAEDVVIARIPTSDQVAARKAEATRRRLAYQRATRQD